MKKGWKVFWIVCLIIALLGVGLCVAGFALGFNGRELQRAFGDFYVERAAVATHESEDSHDAYEGTISENSGIEDLEAYSEVDKLSIDMGAGELIIKTYDGEGIRCNFRGINTRITPLVEQDDEELSIEIGTKKHHIFTKKDIGRVVIYVPENQELKELSLDIGAGNVDIGDVNANDISMNCGAGKIQYSTSKKEQDYNYNIDCGIGEVIIGNYKYSGLGNERTVNNGSDRNMNIDCGVGQVIINFIK